MQCKWSFCFADIPESKSVVRHGFLRVVDSTDTVGNDLNGVLRVFGSDLLKVDYDGPANVLHFVASGGENYSIEKVEAVLKSQKKELNMLGVTGVSTVNLCVPVEKKDPLYYSSPQCGGYKEAPLRRNMRSTFHHLLELSRLHKNFNLECLPAVHRNAQVYVGTKKTSKPARGGPPQIVLVRGISHAPVNHPCRHGIEDGCTTKHNATLKGQFNADRIQMGLEGSSMARKGHGGGGGV